MLGFLGPAALLAAAPEPPRPTGVAPAQVTPAAPAPAEISPAEIAEDIALLASPALRGRAAGSPEAAFVARWLAQRFRLLGLQPAAEDGGYLQPVPLRRIAFDPAATALAWRRAGGGGKTDEGTVRHGAGAYVELTAMPVAPGAELETVFAGFGISAPERGHDDYRGLDVAGRAVIVLAGEPKKPDGTAALGEGRMTRHGLAATKVALAHARGARLVVVVSPAGAPPLETTLKSKLRDLSRPRVVASDSGERPALVHLSAEASAPFHGLAPGPVAGLTLRLEVGGLSSTDVTEHNVVGLLPASSAAAPGAAPLIVGAHFDHIGEDRRPDGTSVIYPGADDNASGVAGLLAIARALAAEPPPPRPVLFVAFASEEPGALGAAWLAAHPLPAGARPFAVISLDMIGRNALDKESNANVAMASFTARATALMELLPAVARAEGVDVRRVPYLRPSARSDDTPFAERGIPALMIFTGAHADYHAPGDVAERIDPDKAARIARLAAQLARRLAALDALPWDETLEQPPPADPWDRPY